MPMGHDGCMILPHGLIVCLDDHSADALIGPVEVMVQEGLTSFSLPVHCEALAEMVDIYSGRAWFGVHHVLGADDLARAVEVDAQFALADDVSEQLVTAREQATSEQSTVPLFLPAMTPTEVRRVVGYPGVGVHLFPADVVGQTMAGHLKSLDLIDRVIPRGGLGAFAAGEWLEAGAPAACVAETLLGNALTGGDLGQLRDRCTPFVTIHRRYQDADE